MPSLSTQHQRKTLFQNPLLEKLTYTPIWMPISLFFVGSALFLSYGLYANKVSFAAATGFFVIGWLVFTLLEYAAHRYLFHLAPVTAFRRKLTYTVHGVHHEQPKDQSRLAMPIPMSVLASTIFFFSFQFVLGDYVFGFFPGFTAGYALYLWVHYAVHARRPPKSVLRILWIHHSIHHYKEDDRAFGVSSPLWDFLLGTMPSQGMSVYEKKK